MIRTIENRMVRDLAWENLEKTASDEGHGKTNRPGYVEIGTRIFVDEENAYDYALERVSQDDELKQEFVEWFYAGNWIKEY